MSIKITTGTYRQVSVYLIGLILVATIITMTVVSLTPSRAQAAPVTGFSPGRIIDDAVFTNVSSLNAEQIQIFLNSKVPACDTWGEQPSEYGGGTRAEWGAAHGNPAPFICLKDYSEGGKSAAQIIYDAAHEFQINPQVFIVLLQKEQGLITDTWPLATQYRTATGYGCPDTAPCDSQYYGLTNQIRWSGRMFRAIMNNSPTWYTPYILGDNFIRWSPNSACGGSNVYIENRSTQALYNYTPYQPNQAALNAGYGTGDSCSAYGNRNFFQYFKDWFGSTQTIIPYAWRLVSQEAYTDSNRTINFTDNDISLAPGQTAYLRVRAQNMGYRQWEDTVRLGTSKPQDRSSVFADSSWWGTGRINKNVATVSSGNIATFEFSVTAPQDTGTYKEYFNLVADGSAWMNDLGMYYTLNVVPRIQADSSATKLAPGEELAIGNYLLSPEKQSVLTLQGDGNLVLYSGFKPRWSTNSHGSTATRLVMQEDGNLVLYKQDGSPLWASGTQGNTGASMYLQIDGNIVVYSSTGTPLWDAGFIGRPDYLGRVSQELPISDFYPGQTLQTTDRKYKFILQQDGNLVLYSQNKPVWASTTAGTEVSHAAMQPDGNLVLYSESGTPLWHSGTFGRGSSRVAIQPDGNLVIYNNDGPTWFSNTQGQ